MAGSGAGLNRVGNAGGVVLLTLNPSSTAQAITSYGNAGNDSGATGPMLVEATGFSKLSFQLVPSQGSATFAGYTVTILGTLDSRAYGQWRASHDPMAYYGVIGGPPVVPAGAWFVLDGPANQSGEGTSDANPLTAASPSLYISRPLVAVRAVLTAVAGAAGNCQVVAFAIP